jgi:hypothetical protein
MIQKTTTTANNSNAKINNNKKTAHRPPDTCKPTTNPPINATDYHRKGAGPPAVPPNYCLHPFQQQDMARISKLANSQQTSIRTNILPTTEMYIRVSERNAAQENTTTRTNFSDRNEQRRKPNNGDRSNPKQNSK